MITYHGDTSGSEGAAAKALGMLFLDLWPTLGDDKAARVDIFVGAKLYGQRVRDVDLLVLIDLLESPRQLSGLPEVVIETLCLTIEVKDHDPSRVRFQWNKVEVQYDDGWKNACDQAFEQMNALRRYARGQGIRDLLVQELVWLRGVREEDVPEGQMIVFGAGIDATHLLRKVAANLGEAWLRAGRGRENGLRKFRNVVVSEIVPTPCDRRRLEAIFAETAVDGRLKSTGTKLQLLRGQGGTGKTMMLLHAGWRAHVREAARVLVLTYNRALRSDLRRQLELMGVSEGSDFEIRTVHSFMRELFVELGYLNGLEDEDSKHFFERLEGLGPEVLAYITSESRTDIERFVNSKDSLRRSLILIDEGQDWPEFERDILLRLYGPQRIIVADGVEQLVRGAACNWVDGLQQSDYNVVPLDRSLRMMRNLGEFVNGLADEFGIPSFRVNNRGSEPGGTVLVVEGDYLSAPQLHSSLVSRNSKERNSNVDMLFVVPPMLVDHVDGDRVAYPGVVFEGWGYSVWDGTSSAIRDGFPVNNDQLRIVQYESCRGLEGWTVVALGVDQFYGAKAEESNLSGFRWLMIPLTRAISHLVLTVDKTDSALKTMLKTVRRRYPEIVEWRVL